MLSIVFQLFFLYLPWWAPHRTPNIYLREFGALEQSTQTEFIKLFAAKFSVCENSVPSAPFAAKVLVGQSVRLSIAQTVDLLPVFFPFFTALILSPFKVS